MEEQKLQLSTTLTKVPLPIRICLTIPVALAISLINVLITFLFFMIPVVGEYAVILLWVATPIGAFFIASKAKTGLCPICKRKQLIFNQESLKCPKCKNQLIVNKVSDGWILAKAPS